MIRAIVLHKEDNVATLLDGGRAGDTCELQGEATGKVTLLQDVPFGHKVCLAPTAVGTPVLKYGVVIGKAREAMRIGEHAHIHNIESTRGRGDLERR